MASCPWLWTLVLIAQLKISVLGADPLLRISGPKIDMTAFGATAVLRPRVDYRTKVMNAFDGLTRKGRSGPYGWVDCLSTPTRKSGDTKILTIDLRQQYYITNIRLHLRDNSRHLNRQMWQDGLTVELTNTSNSQRGPQCGQPYSSAIHGQSPTFACSNTAEYVLITLRNSIQPLQICEIEAFGVPKLQFPGRATVTLYPDTFQYGRRTASALHAVDGISSIGSSGPGYGVLFCASTKLSRQTRTSRKLQYLRVQLPSRKYLYFVRLQMRDGDYPLSQRGLTVGVSNSENVEEIGQCGSPYDYNRQGQSPVFSCHASGLYVWLVLKTTDDGKSLQVCEIEVFATATAPAYCRRLTVPRNGRVQYSPHVSKDVPVTAVATYICNAGYVRSGDKSRTCLGQHKWSGSGSTCSVGVCPVPSSLSNGHCTVGNRRAGDKRTCQCNRGYLLNGSNLETATCVIVNNKAVWNPERLNCIAYCDIPSRPINGSLQISGVDSDYILLHSSVTYRCINDNVMTGTSQRTCIGPNRWQSQAPTCKVGKCPRHESIILHGHCLITTIYAGGRRNCTCERGYKVKDGDVQHSDCVVIDNEAVWSFPLPTCEARNCPVLQPPRNCSMDSNLTAFGSPPVNFVCDNRYEMTYGSRQRYCLATGRWSGIQPICRHVCARQNQCENPARECTIDSKSQATWRCMGNAKCLSNYNPVCAQNGNEYNNKCEMRLAGCAKGNDKIDIARQGKCRFGGKCSGNRPAPSAGSTCRGVYYRFFYNTVSESCEQYVHGECYNGRNMFYTEEDCNRSCRKSDPCILEFDRGSCNFLNERRWYFHRTSGDCQPFMYGGCFGNENHFLSKAQCMKKCRCTVCNSPVTLPLAKSQFEAVLVLQINSQRQVSNAVVSYNAKVMRKCRFTGNEHLQVGDKSVLLATERRIGDCRCPRLDRGVKYRVGVNVIGKISGKWQMKMTRNFYAEMAQSC